MERMLYFTISEFARLRNININSLRYYEKIGILKPHHVDAQNGYRYYSPDQLPILDVILLCLDFGMPLKELRSYISDDHCINNGKLFEIGQRIARERLHQAQIELNKIEYTQCYMQSNQQYSETVGLYRREIPERTIVTADYQGDLADVRRIEMSSAQLYRYAQDKKLSPVFPAGLILQASQGEIRAQLYLEIMEKDTQDPHAMVLPEGTFLCSKLDMTPDMDLPAAIHRIYEDIPYTQVIVANILLDQFQIGTKRSEVQMLCL